MPMLSVEFVIWLGKLKETNPDMFYKVANITFCVSFVILAWLITDAIYSKKKTKTGD